MPSLPCLRPLPAPTFFPVGSPQPHPSNSLKTTTYNPLTFLPFATLVQFKRVANIYFLLTAVLQFIPAISPLSPVSAVAPLIFVLVVSLGREAVEEVGKWRYDREANRAEFEVWGEGWQKLRSDQLRVGHLIKIYNNERIPADLVLLATSSPDGKAYIQTSSLDGEKNLKMRTVLACTQQLYHSPAHPQPPPVITVEQPNQLLYSFNGMFEHLSPTPKPSKTCTFLKISQFLYRESVLRNTEYIIGVICYAGPHTKSMMNSIGGRDKMSTIERKANLYMVCIFVLQLCLIVLCGVLRVWVFGSSTQGQAFSTLVLRREPSSPIVEGLVTASAYFILLNTMIPISLLVSIEVVKFGQGVFIGFDMLMAREEGGQVTNARAFRSSINEQLGMVQYVFTDKTGTLTRNQMVLKKIIAGRKQYTNTYVRPSGGRQRYQNADIASQMYKNAYQYKKEFLRQLKDSNSSHDSGLENAEKQKFVNTLMATIMASCHECLLSAETGAPEYHGSSPDEIALVDSAAHLGMQFMENSYNKVRIRLNESQDEVMFSVEDVFEFDSDRKRMSVVLSHAALPDWRIVFAKGADSAIDRLLHPNYKTGQGNEAECYRFIRESIDEYSRQGLRTLLFAYKLMPTSIYRQAKEKLVQFEDNKLGNKSIDEVEKQHIINQIQSDLLLCGATGVEDKLQDQVEQVIQDLIKANIKVCMLTGDKLETAENIAKSCRLFKQEWPLIRITEDSRHVDIFKGYCEAKDYQQRNLKYGMLIQGSAIANAIESQYFSEMLQHCAAAVCCRITPKNKAQVVSFAKDTLKKLVLAIGDGANDVPMIQAANIGVGLYGNQGMNAVQASDFAMPEFKSLWRLLFVHGRWNYIRIAELIKYFFYKNMVFTLGQLWYAYLCGFSGTSIYNATYLVLYNTIFTAGPVVIRALLEQDLNYVQIVQEISREHKQKSNHEVVDSTLKEELLASGTKSPHSGIKQNNLKGIQTVKSLPMQLIDPNYKANDQRFVQPQQIKPVTKIVEDKNMKHLFPLLYAHSQQQLSLTPKTFFLTICESIAESFCIFLAIYFGIEAPELWIFSICLYTVIFALVTIRICYDINYWTWLMVSVILLTSVVPYVVFVYLMSLLEPELWGTFQEIFTMADFYLCVGLALGLGAFIQATFSVMNKYYFPTAVDFVRKEWKEMAKRNRDQSKRELKQKKLERSRLVREKYNQIMESSRLNTASKDDRMNSLPLQASLQLSFCESEEDQPNPNQGIKMDQKSTLKKQTQIQLQQIKNPFRGFQKQLP